VRNWQRTPSGAAAAQEWEPSLIAQHLLSIAADFNSY